MKVAEIHDVYMAVSGESVYEEVHPYRVIVGVKTGGSRVGGPELCV